MLILIVCVAALFTPSISPNPIPPIIFIMFFNDSV